MRDHRSSRVYIQHGHDEDIPQRSNTSRWVMSLASKTQTNIRRSGEHLARRELRHVVGQGTALL